MGGEETGPRTAEPSPRPGGAARTEGGRGRRGWGGFLARGLLAVGLLAFTGWNFTRSTALAEAQAAYERSDWRTALRRALDHLDRRPWSVEATRLAARCLSKLDFADLAEPRWLRAGTLSRDDLHVRALGIVRANQRARAIQAYEAILRRWPGDAEALRIEATVLITQSRWREARALAERLAKVPGSEVIGETMLATINHNLNEPADAVAAGDRLLARDPALNRVPASLKDIFLFQYAEDLLSSGQVHRARDLLRRIVAEKEDPRRLELLGRVYQKLAEHDEAEAALRRAAELDPTFSPAWSGLGRLAIERRRPAEAVEPLRRAIALTPNAYEPNYSLMLAYQQLGKPEEAERFRRRVEQIRGKSPPATTGMGAMPSHAP